MSRFVHHFRVRYHETDPQQFVFNSRYLEYADIAMTEFFRHLGWGYLDLLAAGYDPSLVTSTLDFLRPARLDDQLAMTVSCDRIGTSSTDLTFLLHRSDEHLCTIRSRYVNVELSSGRATPIPAAIAETLKQCTAIPDGDELP